MVVSRARKQQTVPHQSFSHFRAQTGFVVFGGLSISPQFVRRLSVASAGSGFSRLAPLHIKCHGWSHVCFIFILRSFANISAHEWTEQCVAMRRPGVKVTHGMSCIDRFGKDPTEMFTRQVAGHRFIDSSEPPVMCVK